MLTHPSKEFDRWWARVERRADYARRMAYHHTLITYGCLFNRCDGNEYNCPRAEFRDNLREVLTNAGVRPIRGDTYDIRTALPIIENATVSPYPRLWRRIENLREQMVAFERDILEFEKARETFRGEISQRRLPGDYRSDSLFAIYNFVPTNRSYEHLDGYALLPVRD